MKNPFNNLTIKHLKLNKKRTISTAVGIILATILITGIITIGSSARELLIRTEKQADGDYHVVFSNLTEDQVSKINYNPAFEDSKPIIQKTSDTEKEGLNRFIAFYNNDAFNKLRVPLIKGKLPAKVDEILVSSLYLSDNAEAKIGSYVNILEKKYKITGIADTFFSYIGYSNQIVHENFELYTTLKKPKNVYEEVEKIKKSLNLKDMDIRLNESLLMYQGVSKDKQFNQFLYGVIGILIAIVIVGTSSLIYTSFSMSIAERKKEIGILKSVGATPNQIRKSILKEGLLLYILVVPFAMIMTFLIAHLGADFINKLLKPFVSRTDLDLDLKVIMDLKVIILSALFILLNVLISVFLPSIKASKVSPIKVIRQQEDIKIKAKKLRKKSLAAKIHGLPAKLAKKSINRNKKRYTITNIALAISIIVFISFSSLINLGMKSFNMLYAKNPYNMRIMLDIKAEDLSSFEKEFKKITKEDYVIEALYFSDSNCNIFTKEAKKINKMAECYYSYKLAYIPLNPYNLKKGEGVLYTKNDIRTKNKVHSIDVLNLKKGDSLKAMNKEFKIKDVVSKKPKTIGFNDSFGSTLIVNKESLNEYLNKDEKNYYSFIYKSKDANLDQEKFEDLDNFSVSVNNMQKEAELLNVTTLIISIFVYSFLGLISLIAVTNIFNIITSNIELKKREYINIKAIGATEKTIKKLIFFESYLYIVNAIIYGCLFGITISFMLYKLFGKIFIFNYAPPYKALLITIIFVAAIVLTTTRFMVNKILKNNLIDVIRDENV